MVTIAPPEGDGGKERREGKACEEEGRHPPRDCLPALFPFPLFFSSGANGVVGKRGT